MQDFLSSNEDVTLVVRNGLLLKYKSVARRSMIRAGVPPEERRRHLEAEMERFATAVNPDALSADYFNSSFRSAAPSTLNQTARSMYYQEESVANTTSRSVFHEEEEKEDEVEIVLDSSPPRMAMSHPPLVVSQSPQAVSYPRQEVEHSPQPPSPRNSPLQPQFSPQAASSSHQLVSVASPSFLGCPAAPLPDEVDAYQNNNSFVDTVSNNPEDYFSDGGQLHPQVPRFCSTPNPYLAPESNAASYETPRFASTPNPYLEPEPNPEPTTMDTVSSTTSPSFEELVRLVKNIKKLDSSQQQNLLEHIRKLERENPSLVMKIHQQLNRTDLQ